MQGQLVDDALALTHLKSVARKQMEHKEIIENIISDWHRIATVLNPDMKKLSALCSSDKATRIHTKIRGLLEVETISVSRRIPESVDPPSQKRLKRFVDRVDNNSDDELTLCLAARFSPEQTENVVSFWRLIGAQQFPHLSGIARLLLCIPASSASSERAFSSLENIVRKRRERLNPQTVKALSFLHSNL